MLETQILRPHHRPTEAHTVGAAQPSGLKEASRCWSYLVLRTIARVHWFYNTHSLIFRTTGQRSHLIHQLKYWWDSSVCDNAKLKVTQMPTMAEWINKLRYIPTLEYRYEDE